ncbi:sensor histidine kinase [Maledivibacter halophilus]|uniref:histidine kinase n=1 Tax=Maledivibacter halophilus TaxID=36842 RepID=A0A1T5ICL0_9FIRM|nr:HAMP domain-containing sensor histidine kinase [Maledivibacter halophilus]SKC36810.1 Histidine kinase-, DNA gyrase B-, and HSP90-like ATPase [Maledivibacter halophilus]
MKTVLKLITFLILIVYLTYSGLIFLENNLVEKIEPDVEMNFDFDAKQFDPEKIYLLIFYTNKFNIISKEKIQLSLLSTGLKTKYSFFKNGNIASQNYNTYLDGYTDNSYMKIPIEKNDYDINGVCKIQFEVLPSPKNSNSRLFLGERKNLDDFIIIIYVIKTITITMAIMAAIIAVFIGYKKKDIYLAFLGFTLLLSPFYFEIGLKFAIISLSFTGTTFLKKKEKMASFIIFLILIILLNVNIYFLLILLVIKLYDQVKNYNVLGIFSFFFLGVIYAIVYFGRFKTSDAVRIFSKEIGLSVFIIFIFSYAIYYFVVYLKRYDDNVSVDLLRGISHDFKIPLSVIKLNTEILAEGFPTEAKRNSINASTNNAIKDLERMIGSLTIYLSKNNYINKKFNTSVKESIEKTEKSFKNNNKNIDFEVIYDNEDIFLPIDTIWFDRLIYNLVDNAFKYSYDGDSVILEYRKKKNRAIISVIDTGIGMSSEQLSKIFIPFYRVDKSRNISGLGLGLAVIKNIVDKLDGNIKVASKVNEGTKVTVEVKGK